MKRILLATAFLMGTMIGFSQPCTPNAATGNPGVSPAPDSIACIERGVYYEQIMHLENYTGFTISGFNVAINYARVDSLKNFPCGISWETDTSNNTYGPGETGCIRVFGTTRDAVGQYPLEIYMTMSVKLPLLGDQEASGEIRDLMQQLIDLVAQLGGTLPFQLPNLDYYTRVINQGGSCPVIDTSGINDLTSFGESCAKITGTPAICAGGSTTLTASTSGVIGTGAYSWSTGATTASITVSSVGNYAATVTDNAGTVGTASVSVTQTPLPVSNFTSGGTNNITFTNTSTNATGYSWTFGDGSPTSTLQSPTHSYTANGTYQVRLIVTNGCGADTTTKPVTIIGVFISAVQYDLNFDVYPNPSNGNIALQFNGDNSKNYELRIFDLSGKSVYAENISSLNGSITKQLNLSGLAKGVYSLRLDSEKGFGMKKLVLE